MSFPLLQPLGRNTLRPDSFTGKESSSKASRAAHKHKSPRACVNCRARKVRCDGAHPQCRNCLISERPCVYLESRRNRLKTATEQNQEMIHMLKELRDYLPDDKKEQVQELLGRVTDDVVEATATLGLQTSTDPDNTLGEANVSAKVGSSDETDILDEDLLRDENTRAIGFVGKSSELRWLQRLRKETERPVGVSPEIEGIYGPPGDSAEAHNRLMEDLRRRRQQESHTSMSTSIFYLDNEKIEVDYTVDPYGLPPIEVAQRLLGRYMNTVQDTFPVLSKQSFTSQVRQYYSSRTQRTPCPVPDNWLAMLNLVFAIGAKYSHLTEVDWQADSRDHLVYQSRAHVLSLNGPSLVSQPDLMQIQTTALLAFYFLSVGRVNRAWVVLGTALRFAYAFGLHLRNKDMNTTVIKRETLVQLWWALYSLEGKLSTIVGRPCFVIDEYCSTPLPLPLSMEQLLDETLVSQFGEQSRRSSVHQNTSGIGSMSSDPSNAGSFLKSLVGITMIGQKAMTELYSTKVATRSWKQIQASIANLCGDLETWSASLPSGLNFTLRNVDGSFQRERLILEMYFIRIKILITRPCLCKIDSHIESQSKSSNDFNRNIAQICVNAAKSLADLLPAHIDTTHLYQTGPWWCLVHNIMQALTILLLEISYDTVHIPECGKDIMPFVKKLFRWLEAMKKNDEVSRRAYDMASTTLQELAPRVGVDISDVLRESAAGSTASKASEFQDQFTTGGCDQGYQYMPGEYDHQHVENRQHMSGVQYIQMNQTPMFSFPSAVSQEGLSHQVPVSPTRAFFPYTAHPGYSVNIPSTSAYD